MLQEAFIANKYFALTYAKILLCKVKQTMILRALVFEPNEMAREFLLQVLNRRGYECFAFERAGICAMNLDAG